MPDPKQMKKLGEILEEVRASRTENQRLHAHTDVVLVEAIRMHNEDPHAHSGRISALERRVAALEGEKVGGGEGE